MTLLTTLLTLAAQSTDAPAAEARISIATVELPRAALVIVDRESGQYLGHPTTVLLEDGKTILAAYPKGHGKGAIVLKRSDDGGKSWSERLPTPASWATSQETPTIHRAVAADGRRRLILFSGHSPIRMSHSEDDGKTWSELAPIGEFGGIVAMASVEQIAPGELLAFFHDDGRFIGRRFEPTDGRKFHVFVTESHDGGLSWSDPRAIASHVQAHLCEPGVLRSPDGKRLVALLRENSRKFRSFFVASEDVGKTWSEPRELALELTGDRHVARYGPDGRLFVSFRDVAPGSATRGDWLGWIGSFEDVIQARPGSYRVRLADNTHAWDCAYPGVELLPDGTFVCTTYGHWVGGKPPYIVSARFRLSELDALIERR